MCKNCHAQFLNKCYPAELHAEPIIFRYEVAVLSENVLLLLMVLVQASIVPAIGAHL